MLGNTPEIQQELVSAGAVLFEPEFAQINEANQLENWQPASLKPGLVVIAESGKQPEKTVLTPGATALQMMGRSPGAQIRTRQYLSRTASFCGVTPGYRAVLSKPGDLVRILKDL